MIYYSNNYCIFYVYKGYINLKYKIQNTKKYYKILFKIEFLIYNSLFKFILISLCSTKFLPFFINHFLLETQEKFRRFHLCRFSFFGTQCFSSTNFYLYINGIYEIFLAQVYKEPPPLH